MSEFTLYGFSESGNAYKNALMLELCGADWQVARVAYFTGETHQPEYRSMNVMGESPVLVHHKTDGDLTLSQSGIILDYLAKHFGRFGPKNEEESREIWRWILFDNHKLTSYTATARARMSFQNMPADDPVNQFLLGRMKGAYSVLDAHLDGRDWVVGDGPTIADLSLCAYLFWNAQYGIDWVDYPHIDKWLGRIKALPGWKPAEALMPSGQDK